MRWLRGELKDFKGELIGANSNLYDCLFLSVRDVHTKAVYRDVQWAEAILDEFALSYSLEALGKRYVGEGKRQHLKDLYGENWKSYFSEIHPAHATEYVLTDIDLPPDIWAKQRIELASQGLMELFELESRLTPLLLHMKLRGVPVDIPKAEKLEAQLRQKHANSLKQMKDMIGAEVDPYSGKSIAKAFDSLGITYPRTEKGNPSFKNSWLTVQQHPFAGLLNEAREFEKLRGTFVEGYILNGSISGRIHTSLHPLRRADDEGERGTITGRFSSTNPNLQNIPTRTELGKLIRELFVAEPGMKFYSADFSQMEYRILVHYATLAGCKGAGAAQKAYQEDSSTDFHAMVSALTGLPRKAAKNLNFGLCFGMGIKKLAASLNLIDESGEPLQEALDIMDTYHARAPFIKEIYNLASKRAEQQGFVRTYLGRRCRFNLYEPRYREPGEYNIPLPYEAALSTYGSGIKRSGTHKALNRILQGSNADATKKAMVNIWESGLLKSGAITLGITVHDELDGSVSCGEDGKKAIKQLKEFMTDAIKLNVPVLVSSDTGNNWAEAH
jgi:DNA polymerase I-like protein with 3'-5' exonuclease and polymerase domains